LTESEKSAEKREPEKAEDEAIQKEEKKKKARRRTRGPYRKAHVDW
jgi:hypothetical protein